MGVVGQGKLRSLYTQKREQVTTVMEAGWAPGSIWTGAENLIPPAGIRSPDRPARSQSLHRLRTKHISGTEQ